MWLFRKKKINSSTSDLCELWSGNDAAVGGGDDVRLREREREIMTMVEENYVKMFA